MPQVRSSTRSRNGETVPGRTHLRARAADSSTHSAHPSLSSFFFFFPKWRLDQPMNFEVLPKQPPHQSANTSGSSKKQRHAPATPDDEDIGGVMSDGAQMSGGALASGGLPFVFSIVGGGSPALSPSHVSSASSASQLRSSAKKRVVATAAASASQPRPSPNLRSPYNTSQRTASPAVFTSSQHHHQLHQYHPAAAPIVRPFLV